MPGISRRRFLRNGTLGAAAVGAVAVMGPSTFGASSAAAATTSALGGTGKGLGAPSPSHDQAEVMAHVEDLSAGRVAIFAGTRKVTIQDHAVAQALVGALR